MARRTLYLPVMIAAAMAVACLVALLAVSQKSEAAFPGKNGRIAYVATDGNDQEIYTIDPTGGRPFKLTNNTKDDDPPAYSPNGKKIAYTGFKGLSGDDDEDFDHEIYTIKVGGGGKAQVTDTAYYASHPAWGSRP